MTDLKPWAFELEAYIREGEPDRARKAEAWQTAIGLQAVDGLEVSEYLIDTAKEHIEGKIDSRDARRRIDGYYEQRRLRGIAEEDIEEADKVSQRIAEILGEDTFQFSPAALMAIHKRLFTGIIKGAGEVRPYNITKREWVLAGETVLYAPCELVWESLKYDFEQEASFSYADVSLAEAVAHIAKFASGIWQIHPFCEGNTRTTAVFVIKYLSAKGLAVSCNEFKERSWYFRNALVRANYSDSLRGIRETPKYLNWFFENLLLGMNHELKNRYLHVDWGDGVGLGENATISLPQESFYPESALLVGAAESIWNGSAAKVNIGIEVSAKLVDRMRDELPEQLVSVFITDSDMRHIKRGHGHSEERRGQVSVVPEDFACIPAVLNEFDSCEHTDTDKLGNKKFLLTKNIGGKIYLVTIQRGKRKLEIKTMWKKDLSGASC